jgi:hypothetical protein
VILDPTLVLFVYTCTVEAIVSLGATSIVQGRTALADWSVVPPKRFTMKIPVPVQTLARQHRVSSLDSITEAVTTVAATRHGLLFVPPPIKPTDIVTL